jgi:hypothetical protein
MAAAEGDLVPSRAKATTIFEAAAEFGLETSEILDAVMATLEQLPSEMRASYVDDLSAALAKRLLEKERRPSVSGTHAAAPLDERGSPGKQPSCAEEQLGL